MNYHLSMERVPYRSASRRVLFENEILHALQRNPHFPMSRVNVNGKGNAIYTL